MLDEEGDQNPLNVKTEAFSGFEKSLSINVENQYLEEFLLSDLKTGSYLGIFDFIYLGIFVSL